MIIDFHTHIFPQAIRKNREKYFSEEPAFELLYQSPKAKLASADDLIAVLDTQGVDKAVIFGFPWRNPSIFKLHNDYIINTVDRYPKRFIGFGCFDPFSEEALKETERCIDGGLKGMGELAFYQSGIDKAALECLEPIMAVCCAKDLPVLIHTNEPVGHRYPGKTPNTLNQIYRMVRRFPENKIVLAHWGGGLFFFSLLKKEVKETLKNVYFDTAASPFLYDKAVYQIAKLTIGIDKILFGSDFPLLKPARYFKEVHNCGLDEDDMNRICGLNSQALLKIGQD
jgi:predicted TIM-barrel fold metal-dependent hydrolase